MRERLELGPTPVEETSVQVEAGKDYLEEMRNEVKKYISLLKQVFPWAEDNEVYFRIVCNEHEFGSYYEVAVTYDIEDDNQIRLAYFIENNTPRYWTDTEIIPMPVEEVV